MIFSQLSFIQKKNHLATLLQTKLGPDLGSHLSLGTTDLREQNWRVSSLFIPNHKFI